jgi:RNA 3'-terminal phosphate cyclase (ATP)
MSESVLVDGSYGEGGGQILRTSVSLAAITGKPVEIVNIRAGRSKPGLQAQHLASVRAAAQVCGAELRGDAVGSVHLRFKPTHEPRPGEHFFDIGTAGATTLVAQTVLIPLALTCSSSRVVIRGGTHNPMAPTADYLKHIYTQALTRSGYQIRCAYGPAGFYPRGGGELRVEIGASEERKPFEFIDELPTEPIALIVTSQLDASVADRAEATILSRISAKTVKRVESGPSAGAAVTIVKGCAGFTCLGERGKPMEEVANEAVDGLVSWQQASAAVDEHLADQLVLPALFARGTSSWRTNRVTEHLRSVLWLAEKFCDFEWTLDEESGVVSIATAGS